MPTNKDIVSDAFERWTHGNGSFLVVLANDATWTTMGSGPFALTTRSKQEYIDRMVTPIAARFSTALRPTVRGLWADGDTVIVRWDGDATDNDGKAYHNTYAWFFRFVNGKVVEVTAFFDLPVYDEVMQRVAPRT